MAETPRRCVYTALTGAYEKLLEQPIALDSDIPFICFTDDPDLVSKTWQIRQFTPLLGDDPSRSQREVKLRPHKFLPEFDQSLYIDNSVLLKASPGEVFAAADLASGLSLALHSTCETVLDEFARVTLAQLDDPERLDEQLQYYQRTNPETLRQHPFWNGIMLRDHHNPTMIAAMELWLVHILRFSRRDQLSNRFAFHRAGLRPHILDIDIRNSWFHSWPHVSKRRTEQRTWRKSEQPQQSQVMPPANLHLMTLESRYRELARAYETILASTTWRATMPLRRLVRMARVTPMTVALQMHLLRQRFRRGPSLKKVSSRLIFAFAPPASASGSALLRGHQLMMLIEAASGNVECRSNTLAGLLRSKSETVLLTKSALMSLTPEMIIQLRQCEHRLIADFVDLPIDAALAREMDALLASSITQERYLRTQFPGIPVHLVTHHVDLRLRNVSPPLDKPRLGYFGRPENLLHGKAIEDLVSIVSASNPTRKDWMRRLDNFNMHCALRAPESPTIFKPFTKGFIAAACGAPVIVGADDAEARHYLGPDYKFVIEDLSLHGVRAQLTAFADSFGTPDWTAAQETMREVAAKSSHEHVRAELRALLSAVF